MQSALFNFIPFKLICTNSMFRLHGWRLLVVLQYQRAISSPGTRWMNLKGICPLSVVNMQSKFNKMRRISGLFGTMSDNLKMSKFFKLIDSLNSQIINARFRKGLVGLLFLVLASGRSPRVSSADVSIGLRYAVISRREGTGRSPLV